MSFSGRSVSSLFKAANHARLGQLVQQQHYHVTRAAENQLIIGGLAVAGTAVVLQYSLAAYREFEKNKPAKAPEDAAKVTDGAKAGGAKKEEAKDAPSGSATTMFETWFAKNFYDGGFEDKMSRREAALILGVRESATPERIKEAHRRILLLNHPDRGGSQHLAAKINEAKELLLKFKQ